MKLSAENNHLLQKRFQQVLQPVEICVTAIASTFVSALIFYCRCFELRHKDSGVATILTALCILISGLVVLVAFLRCRNRRPARPWIVAAVLLIAAVVSGFAEGDQKWYKHTASYFLYGSMASYVNVDPGADQGQTFMDAGTIYFKDGSFVLGTKSLAFRNGKTYCVAPILHDTPPTNQSGSQVGRSAPTRSGTVDFWAVGTDCCGRGGTFTCDDAESGLARSGLRLLDDSARSMYLLAVQEWSAGTGIPVRHPVFFHWVKDPLAVTERIYSEVWQDYELYCIVFFLCSGVAAFAMHRFLLDFKVS
mmetsp:Transcript_1873/g.4178  ORF Transcript_1873/g.4178 Transcript_1873/m.4178 type:complete len:306 (+) Transcript_1873:74-991(+)